MLSEFSRILAKKLVTEIEISANVFPNAQFNNGNGPRSSLEKNVPRRKNLKNEGQL